jgi:hypothetical protein
LCLQVRVAYAVLRSTGEAFRFAFHQIARFLDVIASSMSNRWQRRRGGGRAGRLC